MVLILVRKAFEKLIGYVNGDSKWNRITRDCSLKKKKINLY